MNWSGDAAHGDFERSIKTEMKLPNLRAEQEETAAEQTKPKTTISDETIEAVAVLAKLEINTEEREQAKKDMEEMLAYIDRLNELDTDGIEPMFSVFQTENVFREDIVVNGDGSEAALANAPEKKNGCFQVPKTIA